METDPRVHSCFEKRPRSKPGKNVFHEQRPSRGQRVSTSKEEVELVTHLVTIDEACMAPSPPVFHVIPGEPPVLLLVDSSRLYLIDEELEEALENGSVEALYETTNLRVEIGTPDLAMPSEPLAISLN